ncbi:hypothetical protein NPIL_660181 [Nephila pilipes]|uniref:Uncharacterized protein n=1 Tax=Nephila pilipes TaxID=299642 RepID=A0A8X6MFK9_NEPPI|nr:hypothetical protein NPIL_660181 [Nephila pilipes]
MIHERNSSLLATEPLFPSPGSRDLEKKNPIRMGADGEKRGFSFMFISLLQWRGSFTGRNEELTISERKCLLGNTSSWGASYGFYTFFFPSGTYEQPL